MRWVIDTSVALKWFIEEEHTDIASRVLSTGNSLYSIDLMHVEFAHVMCKLARGGKLNREYPTFAFEALSQYQIEVHDTRHLLKLSMIYAKDLRASVFDCCFLALATTINTPVLTADRRFFNAVATSKVPNLAVWLGDLK